MTHLMNQSGFQARFDHLMTLQLRDALPTSDAGLLACREFDDALRVPAWLPCVGRFLSRISRTEATIFDLTESKRYDN